MRLSIPRIPEGTTAVTDRTAWTLNNADENELTQGLSSEITPRNED